MEPREASEAGVLLRIHFAERKTENGFYVEARASFRSPTVPCTIHLITQKRHPTREAADEAIVSIARQHGWGAN